MFGLGGVFSPRHILLPFFLTRISEPAGGGGIKQYIVIHVFGFCVAKWWWI